MESRIPETSPNQQQLCFGKKHVRSALWEDCSATAFSFVKSNKISVVLDIFERCYLFSPESLGQHPEINISAAKHMLIHSKWDKYRL